MNRRWILPAALCAGLAACASQPTQQQTLASPLPAVARCPSCGHVERIELIEAKGDSRANGAVLGGVVGGVLSNPVGNDSSRAVSRSYRISVRMDDGRHLTFIQGTISPNLRQGSPVRIDNGRVVLMR